MAGVLTEASLVSCGHGAGKVATTGSPKLTVSGAKALLASGIKSKSVGGCTTVASADASGTPVDKPCTTVTDVNSGNAAKLTIGGVAVQLDTVKGDTDGLVAKKPPGTLGATALQTKLTAK